MRIFRIIIICKFPKVFSTKPAVLRGQSLFFAWWSRPPAFGSGVLARGAWMCQRLSGKRKCFEVYHRSFSSRAACLWRFPLLLSAGPHLTAPVAAGVEGYKPQQGGWGGGGGATDYCPGVKFYSLCQILYYPERRHVTGFSPEAEEEKTPLQFLGPGAKNYVNSLGVHFCFWGRRPSGV